MKTYYKNKRNKVGLSQSDMARELGIPCVKYEQIERRNKNAKKIN